MPVPPIELLARWALRQQPPQGDLETALQRRLAHMRAGTPHLTERVFSNGNDPDGSTVPGTIVEIRGVPMPGGGFVATFTRSEEHTSALVTNAQLVCRLLLEKK